MFAGEAPRVLAGLLTGIGFLGAGVIMCIELDKDRNGCHTVWTNDESNPIIVPKASLFDPWWRGQDRGRPG
jgi:hypothetical protein